MTPIPIPSGYKNNFTTLLKAAKNGDLALLSCIDKATQKPVMAVCAMSHNADGSFLPIPLAHMFDSDPYQLLEDPTPHLNTVADPTRN